MDPLLSHAVSKFRLMFIPDLLLKKLPPFISSLIISLLPVTPVNLIVFLLVLTLIYTTNLFNMSRSDSFECRDKTLVKKSRFSFWTLVKNTYYYYFLISYVFNLLTLTDYQLLNVNAIASMT
jgi:hypothetical protein